MDSVPPAGFVINHQNTEESIITRHTEDSVFHTKWVSPIESPTAANQQHQDPKPSDNFQSQNPWNPTIPDASSAKSNDVHGNESLVHPTISNSSLSESAQQDTLHACQPTPMRTSLLSSAAPAITLSDPPLSSQPGAPTAAIGEPSSLKSPATFGEHKTPVTFEEHRCPATFEEHKSPATFGQQFIKPDVSPAFVSPNFVSPTYGEVSASSEVWRSHAVPKVPIAGSAAPSADLIYTGGSKAMDGARMNSPSMKSDAGRGSSLLDSDVGCDSALGGTASDRRQESSPYTPPPNSYPYRISSGDAIRRQVRDIELLVPSPEGGTSLDDDMLDLNQLSRPSPARSLVNRNTHTSSVGPLIPDVTPSDDCAKGSSGRNSPTHTNLIDDDDDLSFIVGSRIERDAMSQEHRQAANVPESELVDHATKLVFVSCGKNFTPVSWSVDMPIEDVREAIEGTCSTLTDKPFRLRETMVLEQDKLDDLLSQGEDRPGGKLHCLNAPSDRLGEDGKVEVAFVERWYLKGDKALTTANCEELQDGGLYVLEEIQNDPLDELIDPMSLQETKHALELMKRGTNLLKHVALTPPHFRYFQLSGDCKRLIWYSAAKSIEESIVHVSSIRRVEVGPKDPNLIGKLENLTFMVVCKNGQRLTVTAQNEEEFDPWVTGLKAIACSSQGIKITKRSLLAHSRRFRQGVGMSDEDLDAEISLLQGLGPPKWNRKQKLVEVKKKLEIVETMASTINVANIKGRERVPAVSESPIPGAPVDDLSDVEIEANKMLDLLEQAKQKLAKAEELLETQSNDSVVWRMIWFAEIDIENVVDIHTRLKGENATAIGHWIRRLQHETPPLFQSLKSKVQMLPRLVSQISNDNA